MVVRRAVDRNPVPEVLLDLDPGAGGLWGLADEVVAEGQRELLDGADSLLLGEGEDGVLLGVGGQDRGLVTGDVRVAEVAAQRRGHVQVADLVAWRVSVDANQTVLGFSVLICAQDDGHFGSALSGEGARQYRDVAGRAGAVIVKVTLTVGRGRSGRRRRRRPPCRRCAGGFSRRAGPALRPEDGWRSRSAHPPPGSDAAEAVVVQR